MPIMKPDHQRAMLAAQQLMADVGIDGVKAPASENAPAKEILESLGMGLRESLEELVIIAKGSNEGLKSRALDTVLKIQGVLKEAATPAAPSFTIVINDKNSQGAAQSPSSNLNLPEGVNPIFVPRQLHSQLSKDSVDSKTTN